MKLHFASSKILTPFLCCLILYFKVIDFETHDKWQAWEKKQLGISNLNVCNNNLQWWVVKPLTPEMQGTGQLYQ